MQTASFLAFPKGLWASLFVESKTYRFSEISGGAIIECVGGASIKSNVSISVTAWVTEE